MEENKMFSTTKSKHWKNFKSAYVSDEGSVKRVSLVAAGLKNTRMLKVEISKLAKLFFKKSALF